MHKNAIPSTQPSIDPRWFAQQPSATSGVAPQHAENRRPADALSSIALTADQEPFKVTALDAASCHYAMNLPASCCWRELVPLVLGHAGAKSLPGEPRRLGIDRVELHDGRLHVTGRRAHETLQHLAKVLSLLPALGVGSSQQPGLLEVLGATPALMILPKALSIRQQGEGGRVQVEGDPRWMASVLDQVTVRWPSLACGLFGCLTPELQRSLLHHSPTTLESLVATASEPRDRQVFSSCFESGLRVELKAGGDGQRIQAWMRHCPPWAAASLLRIWDDHPDADAKAQWLRGSSDFEETLAVLRDSARAAPSVMEDIHRSPEVVLGLLRKNGIPSTDNPLWSLGVGFIKDQLREILKGALKDAEMGVCYGHVVEVLNLLPTDEPGTLLLHTVLQELAEQFRIGELKDMDSRPMTWLLERLYKDHAPAFAEATDCAFCSHLSKPKATRLQLQADPQGRYAGVDCADRGHLREILACMVQCASTDPTFQERLTLRRDTFQDADGLSKAHWRVQYRYREQFAEQMSDARSLVYKDALYDLDIQCEVYASILLGAAHDKQAPVEPSEIAEISAFIATGQPSRSLFDWLSALLKRYPNDKSYTALVVNMVLSAAGRLYTEKAADPNAQMHAAELMALLCSVEAVPVDSALELDGRLLGKDFTQASAAWTADTLKAWQDKLPSGSGPRAIERAGVLMATLQEAFGSRSVV